MNTLEFLAQVSASIKANGKFVGGKDVKAGSASSTTGDDAAFAVMDGETSFDESDVELATAALEWVRAHDGSNDFIKGIARTVALDDMLFGNASKASWVIKSYLEKDTPQNGDLSAYTDAVFYGTVGGEAAFKGEIVSVVTTNGFGYGPVAYVNISDGRNHLFLWRTNGARVTDLKPGLSVRVIGTIKEHKDYNGLRQTRLVRPKITALS